MISRSEALRHKNKIKLLLIGHRMTSENTRIMILMNHKKTISSKITPQSETLIDVNKIINCREPTISLKIINAFFSSINK